MQCGKRYFRIEEDGSLKATESPLVMARTAGLIDISGAGGGRGAEGVGKGGTCCAGGVGGSESAGRFNAKTATPEQKEAWVHGTFQRISGQYDLMNDIESFGLHRAWKRTLVKAIDALEPGAVLDVACGTGDITLMIAKARPQSRVVGLDFSSNMLEVAEKRAAGMRQGDGSLVSLKTRQENRPPVSFIQASALDMPFADDSFDVVCISFGLRNMSDYQRVLEEMIRVLRPGGRLFCLESSYPTAPVIKPIFRTYFRYVMPVMAGLVARKPAEYQWLNDSTEIFLSKGQLAALMVTCGLVNVRYRSFAFGAAALHSGAKASE